MNTQAKKDVKRIFNKRLGDIQGEINHQNGVTKCWSYRFKPKKLTRWQPCKCGVCGEVFYMMTNHHAQSHGFKNAEAMLEAEAFTNIFEFKGEY